MSKLLYGDSAARLVSERIHASTATLTALKSTPAKKRVEGMIVFVTDSQTYWRFDDSCTLTGDDVLVVTPTAGDGRWLRLPGAAMLKIPVYATTPDATILLTTPTGAIIKLHEFAFQTTRTFTGAAGRALGFSSSNHAGHTGVGNFLGGTTGMMATMLDTTLATGADFQMGNLASGTFDSEITRRVWMKAGDTIRLDALGGGVFGTGVGNLLVACDLLQNAGN